MKRVVKLAALLGALSAVVDTRERRSRRSATKSQTPVRNQDVRVLEVTVPPGVREPLHAHRYPSVLYYISAAHMKEYSPGVPAVDRGHKDDGAVIFLPVGPPHQMQNLESSKPLKAIRVELKKGC